MLNHGRLAFLNVEGRGLTEGEGGRRLRLPVGIAFPAARCCPPSFAVVARLLCPPLTTLVKSLRGKNLPGEESFRERLNAQPLSVDCYSDLVYFTLFSILFMGR